MKTSFRFGIIAICLALVASLSMWTWSTSDAKVKESRVVPTNMKMKTKTICVGRFLIDVPEDAEIKFAPARVSGILVDVLPDYTAKKFNDKVLQVEQALLQNANEYGRPSLEKKLDLNGVNFKATALYYGREKPLDDVVNGKTIAGTGDAISVEAYGLHESHLFHFKGERLDATKNMELIAEVVKKVEARSSDTLPDQPGFCIANGIILDPQPIENRESITMFASLKDHPDVAIRINMATNARKLSSSLLERDAEDPVKMQFPHRVKTLRRQHRVLNGIAGDEVLDRIKEDNGTSAHIFMWSASGKLHDVMSPEINLELETGIGRPGEHINSSLSDDAVVELWDQITQSIRHRPANSAGRGSATPQQRVPLGELSRTGSSCPQTGYWKCVEQGMVGGGATQFFAQGEVMPDVVLQRPPKLWEKLSGRAPSHRTDTIWTLVAYDEAPVPPNGDANNGIHEGAKKDPGKDGDIT